MLSMKNNFRYFLIAALVIITFLALPNLMTVARAAPPPKSCIGTYFMVIGDGAFASRGIWTFSQDGTFQESDSAEPGVPLSFSPFGHGQGVWKQVGTGIAKMKYLDFGLAAGSAPLPSGIGRVDADLTFSNNCQNVAGSLTLSQFDPAGNPLDISTALFTIPGITFTGRQLLP